MWKKIFIGFGIIAVILIGYNLYQLATTKNHSPEETASYANGPLEITRRITHRHLLPGNHDLALTVGDQPDDALDHDEDRCITFGLHYQRAVQQH